MKQIAIKLEQISKAYQLGQIGSGTISKDLERWYARVRRREDPFLKIGETNNRTKRGSSDIVWSLRDISFEVEQGQAVGIIGKNGAGKSTLLKILSKVTAPTSGKISGTGRIASLLEVGTGFHPELTGRENIFLNGAILGMRKKEIQRKLEEIVEFAGIERYIDTPVKRYSSGMYVRLAFAVAAHLESEILIVDEVLAVGDAEFQTKCLTKMNDITGRQGRTVLFVSHNIDSILNLCSQTILLENGILKSFGDTRTVTNSYLRENNLAIKNSWKTMSSSGTPILSSLDIELLGEQPKMLLIINLCIYSPDVFADGFVAFDIKNSQDQTVLQSIPNAEPFIKMDYGFKNLSAKILLPGLIPDTYRLSVWIGSHYTKTFDWQQDIVSFNISESPILGRKFPHDSVNGFLVAPSSITNHVYK